MGVVAKVAMGCAAEMAGEAAATVKVAVPPAKGVREPSGGLDHGDEVIGADGGVGRKRSGDRQPRGDAGGRERLTVWLSRSTEPCYWPGGMAWTLTV